jgi:hypothetical protein
LSSDGLTASSGTRSKNGQHQLVRCQKELNLFGNAIELLNHNNGLKVATHDATAGALCSGIEFLGIARKDSYNAQGATVRDKVATLLS